MLAHAVPAQIILKELQESGLLSEEAAAAAVASPKAATATATFAKTASAQGPVSSTCIFTPFKHGLKSLQLSCKFLPIWSRTGNACRDLRKIRATSFGSWTISIEHSLDLPS